MNKQELKQRLDSLGIYPGFYSLDGDLLPDCIVLTYNYNHWEVFYFDERGNLNNGNKFPSESDACNYVYKHFQKQKEIEQSTRYK